MRFDPLKPKMHEDGQKVKAYARQEKRGAFAGKYGGYIEWDGKEALAGFYTTKKEALLAARELRKGLIETSRAMFGDKL